MFVDITVSFIWCTGVCTCTCDVSTTIHVLVVYQHVLVVYQHVLVVYQSRTNTNPTQPLKYSPHPPLTNTVITYGVIPVQHRLLWVDAVELVWVTILSMYGQQQREKLAEQATAAGIEGVPVTQMSVPLPGADGLGGDPAEEILRAIKVFVCVGGCLCCVQLCVCLLGAVCACQHCAMYSLCLSNVLYCVIVGMTYLTQYCRNDIPASHPPPTPTPTPTLTHNRRRGRLCYSKQVVQRQQ